MVITQCEHKENVRILCVRLYEGVSGIQKLSRRFSFVSFGGDVKPLVLGNLLKLA